MATYFPIDGTAALIAIALSPGFTRSPSYSAEERQRRETEERLRLELEERNGSLANRQAIRKRARINSRRIAT